MRIIIVAILVVVGCAKTDRPTPEIAIAIPTASTQVTKAASVEHMSFQDAGRDPEQDATADNTAADDYAVYLEAQKRVVSEDLPTVAELEVLRFERGQFEKGVVDSRADGSCWWTAPRTCRRRKHGNRWRTDCPYPATRQVQCQTWD